MRARYGNGVSELATDLTDGNTAIFFARVLIDAFHSLATFKFIMYCRQHYVCCVHWIVQQDDQLPFSPID